MIARVTEAVLQSLLKILYRTCILELLKKKSIENLSMNICLSNNEQISIIIVAYSPRYAASFADDIRRITTARHSYIIIADLNARHAAWGGGSENCMA